MAKIAIEEFLKENKSVFLDTMIFIYFFEAQQGKEKELRHLFNVIENGHVSAFTSLITLTEILVKPYKLKIYSLVDEYLRFLNEFPHLSLAPLSQEIFIKAAQLRANYNFKTPDAIQLASALDINAAGFITGDKELLLKEMNFFYL